MAKRLTVPMLRELATVMNDITYPHSATYLVNRDPTLRSRGGSLGLRLYDEVERDAHAYAVLQKRKLAVIARPWDVKPGGEALRDAKAAKAVKDLLNRIPFDRITLDMLDCLLKGFAVGEVMWARQNGLIDITDVRPRDQYRFHFDMDYQLCLQTPENMYPGIPMPQRKFITTTYNGKNRNPYGLGLGHIMWFLVFFKKEGMKFWLASAEKFGSPTIVASVPGQTPPAEQDKALDIAESVSSQTAVVKPDSMILELLESKRASDTSMFENLIDKFNIEISKAVLGQDATTEQSAHGSRSALQTFQQMEKVLTKADADLVCFTLNDTLIKWFVELNFPGAALPRVYRSMDEPHDMTEMAKRDQLVCGMGFKPSLDYIRETYGGDWQELPNLEVVPGRAEVIETNHGSAPPPAAPGVQGIVAASQSPMAPVGQ